jgi:ABC-2 type transport system ATP-binding protein
MQDVTALCPRVIVIDKGLLIYDGDLRALVRKMHPSKLVSFTLSGPVTPDQLERLGELVSHDAGRVVVRVPQNRLRDVVSHSLASLPLVDLTVEDPPVEDIMRQLFRQEGASAGDEESAASGPSS